MLISTKGRYALRVLIEIACHNEGEYVRLDEIAKSQGISEKYLESIVSILVKGKLLKGLRGRGGGYRLTKHPADYSIGEILRLTEGSLAPVACLESGSKKCDRADSCKTLPLWKSLDNRINEFLDSVTLYDLLMEQ